MKDPQFVKKVIWTLSLLLAMAGVASAQVLNNNELEFTGTITEVMPNGDGGGTLFVDVDATDLRVLVNSSTEILKGGDEVITMADLQKTNIIRVDGKFSSGGILASRVQVFTGLPADGFSIRGHITALQSSDEKILVSLLGITIEVTGDLKTEWGATLKIGANVQIDGTVAGQTWTATAIQMVSKEKKHGMVRFEGEVTAIGGEAPDLTITVAVESTPPADQIVIQNSETEVNGDVQIGSFVEVMGKLNTDYSVTAKEITVVGALEIKPDERKIKIGHEATFTVKLRETATSDVPIALEETDPENAITLPLTSVTVPAGSRTADFVVKGDAIGEATITAKLESGDQATATVRVGMFSDEENENPNAAVRVVFAPDHIKMRAGETRDVDLLVHPPEVQLSPENVPLQVTGDVESAVIKRDLGSGTARYKVMVTCKATPQGTGGSVTATLSGVDGAGTAELVVVITNKGK